MYEQLCRRKLSEAFLNASQTAILKRQGRTYMKAQGIYIHIGAFIAIKCKPIIFSWIGHSME